MTELPLPGELQLDGRISRRIRSLWPVPEGTSIRITVSPPEVGAPFLKVSVVGDWFRPKPGRHEIAQEPRKPPRKDMSRPLLMAIIDGDWLGGFPGVREILLNPDRYEPLNFLRSKDWLPPNTEAIQVFEEQSGSMEEISWKPNSGVVPRTLFEGSLKIVRPTLPLPRISRERSAPLLRAIDQNGVLNLKHAIELYRLSHSIQSS